MTNLTSEEWAAWVQAIGSVLAIVAAIWVARKSHYDQLARDAEALRRETISLVQSVQAEVAALYDSAKLEIIPSIQLADPKVGLPVSFPVRGDYFVVYRSVASRIGTIPDEATKATMIKLYAEATAFLDTLQRNSEYAEAVASADKKYYREGGLAAPPPVRTDALHADFELHQYYPKVRYALGTLDTAVKGFFECSNRWLGSQQATQRAAPEPVPYVDWLGQPPHPDTNPLSGT